MHDYKLLEAFTAVIEQKGFEKAANYLNLTQSAVSQRVRLLEESMGQILLVRSNPPTATEAGKKLIMHCKKVQMLETELKNDISGDEEKGFTSISVGLNADSLCTWFFDAVDSTVKKHNLLLKLYVDDQEETHRMMKDGEVSACISTRNKPFQSCSCTYLGDMTYKMYASPEFAEKYFKNSVTADDIKSIPVVVFNEKDTLQNQMFEKVFKSSVNDFPYMYVPDFSKYIDAVMRGYGIGMMPHIQCEQYCKAGKLVDVFSGFTIQTPLYWHRWSISSFALDKISKAVTNKHMLN